MWIARSLRTGLGRYMVRDGCSLQFYNSRMGHGMQCVISMQIRSVFLVPVASTMPRSMSYCSATDTAAHLQENNKDTDTGGRGGSLNKKKNTGISKTTVFVKAKADLEMLVSDLDNIIPSSLRSHASLSDDLTKVNELGSDTSLLSKLPKVSSHLADTDVDKNLEQHISYLKQLGFQEKNARLVLSKNPLIKFQEDLGAAKAVIDYLKSKKFTETQVAEMVCHQPRLLSLTSDALDKQLEYLQKELQLTEEELMSVVIRGTHLAIPEPKVNERIKVNKKELISMGFSEGRLKESILIAPQILIVPAHVLGYQFKYLQKELGVSMEQIMAYPFCLHRKETLRERHSFLKRKGRAQYNPSLPDYVPLKALLDISDREFCHSYAKTSRREFLLFRRQI